MDVAFFDEALQMIDGLLGQQQQGWSSRRRRRRRRRSSSSSSSCSAGVTQAPQRHSSYSGGSVDNHTNV